MFILIVAIVIMFCAPSLCSSKDGNISVGMVLLSVPFIIAALCFIVR